MVRNLFLAVLLVGCGDYVPPEQQQQKEVGEKVVEYSYVEEDPSSTWQEDVSYDFRGYVSPLNISVDNIMYADSEDFYTQEMARLNAEVAKTYPKYKLTFKGDIGLREFKRNLAVFLVATDDVGLALETSVDSEGSFYFGLPESIDQDAFYTVRASKRISMYLVSDSGDTKTWCYNMWAEKDFVLSKLRHVVLREWHTTLTSYKCPESNYGSTAITLPYFEEPTPEKVKPIQDIEGSDDDDEYFDDQMYEDVNAPIPDDLVDEHGHVKQGG